MMYAAGSETTANAVAIILAVLATDAPSMQRLEAVRSGESQQLYKAHVL